MKKLLCILLMIMTITATGCTKQETAEEIYQKAYEKMLSIDSATVTVDMDMDMSISGVTLNMPIKMDIETIDAQNTKNPQVHMVMSMSVFGTSSNTEAWSKDGYVYTITDGNKTKTASSDSPASNYQFDLDGLIKSGTVKKDGDNTVLTLVLNEDAYAKVFKESFASTGVGDMGISPEDFDITMTEMTVVVDKDYNYVSMNMPFDVEGSIQGEDLKVAADMTINYSDINNTTIDFPDFADFDKETTNTTGYDGFEGEGRVCNMDMSEDGLTANAEFTLYPDNNDIIQGIKLLFTFDISSFDEDTQELLKTTLDEEMANEYGGDGVYTNSTIENGIYKLEIDVTDMSNANDLFGSDTSLENANIDDAIKEIEAGGATCQ